MKKLSFKQGMLPLDGLDFSKDRVLSGERILEIFTPKIVVLPLLQHLGTPASILVEKGEEVCAGQMIGKPTSPMSVPIHASISGTVYDISSIRLPSGIRCDAVFIRNDLKKRFDPSISRRVDPTSLTPRDLRRLLVMSGIVGMGGEGVPTAVKCTRAAFAGVNILYVNCLQSEPYLVCDIHLIREQTDRLVHGAAALGGVCRVKKIVFCIEDKWVQEIDILRTSLARIRKEYPDRVLDMLVFKSRFPQGYDRLLMQAIYHVEIPMKYSIEEAVGAVVFNAATCTAFWDVAEKNMPCISRIITISGDTMTEKNVLVPIGSLVSDVIERIPGTASCQRIVLGGSLTGVALSNLDTPIIKTTQGITLVRKSHNYSYPCIHCGACVTACPVGLLPYLANRLIDLADTKSLANENIEQCISCGACSYVCPSGIELSAHIARAAHRTRKAGKVL